MSNELAISVIIDVYASLLGNKTFDIRSAVAATTGRKKISFPENWESLYIAWDNGEITAKEFMDKINFFHQHQLFGFSEQLTF